MYASNLGLHLIRIKRNKEGRKEGRKAHIEVVDIVMLSVAVRMEEPFLPLPDRERIVVVVVIIMTCKASL